MICGTINKDTKRTYVFTQQHWVILQEHREVRDRIRRQLLLQLALTDDINILFLLQHL